MSSYDTSVFDGIYQVGQPQIQVLVKQQDLYSIYQYLNDTSVFNHIKQAGSFILFLDSDTLVPLSNTVQNFFQDSLSVNLNAHQSTDSENASLYISLVSQQSGTSTQPQQASEYVQVTNELEPPFVFGKSVFSSDNFIMSQFCKS